MIPRCTTHTVLGHYVSCSMFKYCVKNITVLFTIIIIIISSSSIVVFDILTSNALFYVNWPKMYYI